MAVLRVIRRPWNHTGITHATTVDSARQAAALAETGSIFVQIGEENVYAIRAILNEVFGTDQFVREIIVTKTSGLAAADRLASSADYILWFCRNASYIKYRGLQREKDIHSGDGAMYFLAEFEDGSRKSLSSEQRLPTDSKLAGRRYTIDNLTKPGPGSKFPVRYEGKQFTPGARWWGTTPLGMERLIKSRRLQISGNTLRFVRFWDDYNHQPFNNVWTDMGTGGFLEPKIYVVQTRQTIVERCILMSTDPGDLVFDPTCGSGTTAYVAEQWGRRWVTVDTRAVSVRLESTGVVGAFEL